MEACHKKKNTKIAVSYLRVSVVSATLFQKEPNYFTSSLWSVVSDYKILQEKFWTSGFIS